jgi:anhydro-N-acetylmuramic acid kinase
MSGTSLDGIDAVLAEIDTTGKARLIQSHSIGFDERLRSELTELQFATSNDLHREHLAANALAAAYAQVCQELLRIQNIEPSAVSAIGAHGQTLRHQPSSDHLKSYTHQTLNAAMLAELTGMNVIANFRARDMAAGGQGAPLVPAFHQKQFYDPLENRAILNIGGIANLTILPTAGEVSGFDCGPGNLLLDAWVHHHLGKAFDDDGRWASTGTPNSELLARMLQDPYFAKQPPKSTGRDHFNLHWLNNLMTGLSLAPEDVQATLLQLTIDSILNALRSFASNTQTLIVCGGGVRNIALLELLKIQARRHLPNLRITSSAEFGIDPQLVESLAFAWLAWAFMQKRPANVPAVTGAKGSRILGALYPA